jgi:hypothetical protein
MKTALFVGAAALSVVAIVLNDQRLAVLLAAVSYGIAAWRNNNSMAAVGAAHAVAAAVSPAATFVLLQAAPAALAVLPLKESPLAVPVAAVLPVAASAFMRLFAAVDGGVPDLSALLPYFAVAAAMAIILYAARR